MDTAIRAFVAALFGLAIGSFLTVVIDRVPKGESVARPRSRCPGCGTQIASRDNIPVVSYLILHGRCRTCGIRIPVRYPLVELASGVAFAAAGLCLAAGFLRVVRLAFAFSSRTRSS